MQLLDYASVYLGIACGIDPLAIAAIKDLRDLTGHEEAMLVKSASRLGTLRR